MNAWIFVNNQLFEVVGGTTLSLNPGGGSTSVLDAGGTTLAVVPVAPQSFVTLSDQKPEAEEA